MFCFDWYWSILHAGVSAWKRLCITGPFRLGILALLVDSPPKEPVMRNCGVVLFVNLNILWNKFDLPVILDAMPGDVILTTHICRHIAPHPNPPHTETNEPLLQCSVREATGPIYAPLGLNAAEWRIYTLVNSTITGSNNGLSPRWCQAIIWIKCWNILSGPLWTKLSGYLIGINAFSFKEMHVGISSVKWRPFFLSLNVLTRHVKSWELKTII